MYWYRMTFVRITTQDEWAPCRSPHFELVVFGHGSSVARTQKTRKHPLAVELAKLESNCRRDVSARVHRLNYIAAVSGFL